MSRCYLLIVSVILLVLNDTVQSLYNQSKVFKVAQVESTARTIIKRSCGTLLTGNN